MPEVKYRCERCGAVLTLDEKLFNRAKAEDEKKNSGDLWLCNKCYSGGSNTIGCAIMVIVIVAIFAHIFYGSYWFISHFKDTFASLYE